LNTLSNIKTPDTSPKISIIMAVRNESKYIHECIEAIVNQDYPKEKTEIIIADGESSDNTIEILSNFLSKANITILNNKGKIVSSGLNTVIKVSKGEYLIRIDGHTIISKNYVSECVSKLIKTGVDCTGGLMKAEGLTKIGMIISSATSSVFGIGNSKFHYSEKEQLAETVYMGAWTRNIFKKIGLFDEDLVRNQDDEFNYRISENGGRILLSPEIKSLYFNRDSIKSLWKQYYQYGFWKVRVLQKHPRQISMRQLIPPTFILSLIITLMLSIIINFQVPLILIIGSYMCANIVATLIEFINNTKINLLILPFVYLVLHISYGLGFLSGFIFFLNKWDDKIGRVPSLEE
jgi:succinoglycan biosynthesis protein ExoA